MSGVLSRFGLKVLQRPRTVAAVALVLVAACAVSLSRLRIDHDLEHLLPPGDPT